MWNGAAPLRLTPLGGTTTLVDTRLSLGVLSADTENVYVEGDLTLTEGTVTGRAVTLIATQDIIIEHEGEQHHDPADTARDGGGEGRRCVQNYRVLL